jgi:hypothetical protein
MWLIVQPLIRVSRPGHFHEAASCTTKVVPGAAARFSPTPNIGVVFQYAQIVPQAGHVRYRIHTKHLIIVSKQS